MITSMPARFAMLSVVAVAAALLTAVALIDQDARVVESAGPYSVANSTIRTNTPRLGSCQPGALFSGNSISAGEEINGGNFIQRRFTAPINDVPGFRGCIAPVNGPQYLVIDNELFKYANVHTQTTPSQYVDSTTQNFNLNVDSCFGFAPSDLIYVGMERMQWDTGICDGPGLMQDYLHIIARPDATDYAHGPRAFVRVHGLLLLVGRGGLPKFLDFSTTTPLATQGICVPGQSPPCMVIPPTTDPIAYTPAAAHNAGALAHSPATYALCIGHITQTVMGGDDLLSARTRCAGILEPGYLASDCDSNVNFCYWPTTTSALPLVTLANVRRRPIFSLYPSWNLTGDQMPPAYDEIRGFIDDDGNGSVTFNDLPVSATGNCQFYFSLSDTEDLYLSSDMSIPGIKNFVLGSGGTGTLYVRYFVAPPGASNPCGGGQNALTINSPFSFTKVDDVSTNPATAHDTDLDGCPDRKELAGTITANGPMDQGSGGWRDPLNYFDYMNATGDGLNRVDDILAVVNQYFLDDPPNNIDLTSTTDRTALKPTVWSLGKPNGQQRVDDILAAVKQYFHDC